MTLIYSVDLNKYIILSMLRILFSEYSFITEAQN